MLLVAATATMTGQDEMEQTAKPIINIAFEPGYQYEEYCIITIYNADEDYDAEIYWGFSMDSYDFNDIYEWQPYEEGNPIYFSTPAYYHFAAFAVSDGKNPSEIVHATFYVDENYPFPLALPLVYAHHVDNEKGLAVRIVDCIAGENYVDPDNHDIYYECYKPDGFYYKINNADEWTKYEGEFFLKDYGVYEIKAMPTRSDGSSSYSGDPVATVIYEPSTFMSQDGIHVVRDGQVYYVTDSESLRVAELYHDGYNMLQYPIISPVVDPDLAIPSTISIKDNVYTVNEIGAFGLFHCFNVSIPSTITNINMSYYDDIYPNSLNQISVDENNPVYDSRNNCNAIIETANNQLILGSLNTVIPDDVTSIAPFAFYGSQLATADIPASIGSIGSNAYYGYSLTRVICRATTPPSGSNMFRGTHYDDFVYGQASLFVPAEAIEDYHAHEEWGKFTHIVPFIGAGPGDITGDGNISIADVTALIDMLLGGGELPVWGDVNGDNNVSIQDVTRLIDYLLNGTW